LIIEFCKVLTYCVVEYTGTVCPIFIKGFVNDIPGIALSLPLFQY
jgi:hypothetical protein